MVEIPKNIFIYWATGFEEAPLVIKRCVESWKVKNPGWTVFTLDDSNIYDHIDPIDMPPDIFARLPIQKKANLIRLKLLIIHGGVWADATCYCLKPLNLWLFESAPSGVFMFHKIGRDRLISNWFIASSKGNYLIKTLYEARCAFWEKYNFNHESYLQKKWAEFFCRIINRTVWLPLLWFNPFFTRILKIYPYLIFHYEFYRLLRKDKKFAKIWSATKKISAEGPPVITKLDMLSELTEEKKKIIESTDVPLYKLKYKFDESKLKSNSVLQYILDNY